MRYHELVEMPLSITPLSDMGGDSSFRPDDVRLVQNKKALEKIHRLWQSSVCDVNLYLVDLKIDPTSALSIAIGGDYDGRQGVLASLSFLEGMIEPKPQNIGVIFTQNEGSARKPLTGWIIAHRMYHAFQNGRSGPFHNAVSSGAYRLSGEASAALARTLSRLGGVFWDENPKSLACMIGTSKSCRDGTLNSQFELLPECFAQYMLRGAVRLNHIDEHRIVEEFEQELNEIFATLINTAKGSIYAL
jgi:hypothetical protein